MFGKQPEPETPPAASEVAKILGGGLAQMIVTRTDPLTFSLFLNDRGVPQLDVESLLVELAIPLGNGADGGKARATLSQYVKTVAGERSLQATELFPCTFELIALGRRIVVTCQQVDSLDGAWIGLGLKPDGTAAEVTGVQALRILVTEGILDAKLTWVDGVTEDLLATPAPSGN
jgi:hypothetical protein